MSAVIPNIAKYSVLFLLAIVFPTLVFGVMSVYIGYSPMPFTIVQLIALAGVTIKLARERFLNGVLFALGAAVYSFLAGLINVPDLFLQGFSAILGPIVVGIWNTVFSFFAYSVVVGAMLGLIGILAAPVTALVSFLLTAVIMLIARLSRLLYEAAEAATSIFIKAIPNEGVMAVLAPYYGGILIGLPFAIAFGVLAIGIAVWVGLMVGMAIVGFMPFNTSLILFGLTSIFTAILLKPEKIPVIDVVMDVAALMIAPFTVPLIWTVGYALLTSRRYAHRGLYFIGLSAAALTFYASVVTWLSQVI